MSKRLTLLWHGGIYLCLGAAASGGLENATALLLGNATGLSGVNPAAWASLAAALVSYGLGSYYSWPGRAPWSYQLVLGLLAGAAAWQLAGVSVGAVTQAYHELSGQALRSGYCCTIRTIALAGGAILIAWIGKRWKRIELTRLVYPLMVLGAYKLLTQDLRHEDTMALFLSLLLYGATLTVLPRLVYRTGAAG